MATSKRASGLNRFFITRILKPCLPARTAGSVIEPLVDQLPGSCTDYYAVGHWTEVGFSTAAFDFRKARQTSPVEEDGRPLPVAGGAVRVTLEPYGMATIRLQ